jgi:hypothetical protein
MNAIINIIDAPGVTVLLFPVTQRAAVIGVGGLTTVGLSWNELETLVRRLTAERSLEGIETTTERR